MRMTLRGYGTIANSLTKIALIEFYFIAYRQLKKFISISFNKERSFRFFINKTKVFIVKIKKVGRENG
jgi:hypothetical protein